MLNHISTPPLLADTYLNRYTEDLTFWKELAQETNGPILELGCGSGRVLLSITDQDRFVIGLDIERNLLQILKERTRNRTYQQVFFFQGDITNFNLNLKFDLILIACNTYSSLPEGLRKATMRKVKQHISDSGLFVISLPNPALLNDLPATSDLEVEDVFPHPMDGEPVQVSSRWERSSNYIDVFWYYDHLISDGQVRRYQYVMRHYLLPVEDYLAELKEAGFITKYIYGDYDRSNYDQKSPHLIIVSSVSKKI